jgi:gliding motility-associated-like protein
VNVNPLPILVAQTETNRGCKPVILEIEPTSESQNVDQIIWNVAGVGTFVGDSLSISLIQAGIYDVEATAISENNCISTVFFEEVAEVYPSPVAHFTISPSELTTLEPEAEFINHSTPDVIYHWWFNGLSESNEANPTFTFPNERSDNFYVCLDATNEFGCSDTSCRYVYMDAEYVVFAPNAFTPDGDGDNDVWLPVIRGFDTQGYQLSIYNRWGDRVFYSENPDAPWTGNSFNSEYFGQNEVYNWTLKLRVDYSVEEISFSGNIILVR